MVRKINSILAVLFGIMTITYSIQYASAQEADSTSKNADSTAITVQPASAQEILEIVKNSSADAVMLNVWATWCTPCREEFPDMMKLLKYYGPQGLELILVSGDFPENMQAVKQFLAEQDVTFTTYIKTGKDMKFINTLNPDWSGALPATWIFNGDGELVEFWQGKADFDRMEESVLEVLNDNQAGG